MKNVEKHVFFELYNHGKRIGTFNCHVHGETEAEAWQEARTLGNGMLYGINAIRRYKTKCPLFIYEEGRRNHPHFCMDANYQDYCAFDDYAPAKEKCHAEIVCK